MIQYTKDNGKELSEKDTGYQYGIMERGMKAIGWMIVSMGPEPLITMKVMYILVSSSTVKHTATARIKVKMEPNLKVNLKVDKNMESEHIHFLMVNREWESGRTADEFHGSIKIDELNTVYQLFLNI